jgi:hypothetical protein
MFLKVALQITQKRSNYENEIPQLIACFLLRRMDQHFSPIERRQYIVVGSYRQKSQEA